MEASLGRHQQEISTRGPGPGNLAGPGGSNSLSPSGPSASRYQLAPQSGSDGRSGGFPDKKSEAQVAMAEEIKLRGG
jgi:hypothetical protein